MQKQVEGEQVLLEMHLPKFRSSYHAGRIQRLRGAEPVTDISLVESMYALIEDGGFTDDRSDVVYVMGQLMGFISCNVIPWQAEELDPQERRQRFLANFQSQPEIASLIETLWMAQDKLACMLSEDLYAAVLTGNRLFLV